MAFGSDLDVLILCGQRVNLLRDNCNERGCVFDLGGPCWGRCGLFAGLLGRRAISLAWFVLRWNSLENMANDDLDMICDCFEAPIFLLLISRLFETKYSISL